VALWVELDALTGDVAVEVDRERGNAQPGAGQADHLGGDSAVVEDREAAGERQVPIDPRV
jgi:hypothetical protein